MIDNNDMNIPFTTNQFLDIFESYNNSIRPLQILFNLSAIVCIILIIRNSSYTNKIVSVTAALLWLWMGVVYHLIFFTAINKAAYIFGILFVVQAFLIIYYGLIKGKLDFVFERNIYSYTGISLIIFALIVYPVIGYFVGHIYPRSPTFGLPCPTTIFTLGIFLFLKEKLPVGLLIIPAIWSFIGFTAALQLSIYEDTGLLVSGIVTLILTIYKRKFTHPINCTSNHA